MGDSRVVRPESQKLDISKGDWILVRKRLNAGENKRMLRRGMVTDETGRHFDGIEAGTAKLLAYLIDWSVAGPDGQVIAIRGQSDAEIEAALDAIDPESYGEILHAVEAHVDAVDAARAQEKKDQAATTGDAATSPSLSSVAGASSGSGS